MIIPHGNQTVRLPPAQPQGVVISQPGFFDKRINQAPLREQQTEDLDPQDEQAEDLVPLPSDFRRVKEKRCGDKPCGVSGDDGFRPVRPKND